MLHPDQNPQSQAKVIVCGDFNGGPECGAVRYLEDGAVDEFFLEDGEPITSNEKMLPFLKPFKDVASSLQRPPPATLVVPEFISQMVKDGGAYENPELSQDMIERFGRIYDRLATHEMEGSTRRQMSVDDVKGWLAMINREVGRGDEFREAAIQMGWKPPTGTEHMTFEQIKQRVSLPKDGILTLEGFIAVYQRELSRGKFWGIGHDLAVLGEPLPDVGLFQARFDRLYCSDKVQPFAVLDSVCDKPCPNDKEPSDHLPVAATLVPAS
mmetsp:Transcript_28600/g.66476  ORF Transcript_28600/g.66476 Transcript_28600/m.66476 type:complete len:268 (+) Transcript_28600:421-1224(+)